MMTGSDLLLPWPQLAAVAIGVGLEREKRVDLYHKIESRSYALLWDAVKHART